MPFVPPQSTNLQLEEINLWEIVVSFTGILFGIFAPTLLLLLSPCALNHLLVIITDIYVSCHVIEIKLEPPLGDGFLDAFAVGRVAGRAGASLALVDEAADLVGRTPGVLLAGAEAVHPAPLTTILVSLPSI